MISIYSDGVRCLNNAYKIAFDGHVKCWSYNSNLKEKHTACEINFRKETGMDWIMTVEAGMWLCFYMRLMLVVCIIDLGLFKHKLLNISDRLYAIHSSASITCCGNTVSRKAYTLCNKNEFDECISITITPKCIITTYTCVCKLKWLHYTQECR